MATAQPFKFGSWILKWSAYVNDKESSATTIECIGRMFKLSCSNLSNILMLSFEVVESASKESNAEHPLTIQTFVGGTVMEMKKENRIKWLMQYNRRSSRNNECLSIVLLVKLDSIKDNQLTDQFTKLVDNKSSTDVQFVVKGRKFWAHSTLLAAASPVMAAMLDPDKFKEGHTREIIIEDIGSEVFYQLLLYMYTGNIHPTDVNSLEEIFLAADKYQLEALKNTFENYLIWHLKPERAIYFLVVAHRHSALFLLEAALQSLVIQRDAVWDQEEWKELIGIDQNLFFMASHRIATERHCECCSKAIKK